MRRQILSTFLGAIAFGLLSCDAENKKEIEWVPVEKGSPVAEDDSTAIAIVGPFEIKVNF